jgi:hypothetical protein
MPIATNSLGPVSLEVLGRRELKVLIIEAKPPVASGLSGKKSDAT